MGCSVCSIKSRSSFIYRKEDTKVSLQLNLKSSESSITCLKIEIQAALHPIITQNLKRTPSLYSYIENYIDYFTYVKSSYSRLLSTENNFKFQTHSCCLDTNLTSSIKIMLVSIAACNKGQLPVNYLNTLPFFSISSELLSSESLQIYLSWIEYCKELKSLMDPEDPTLSLHECSIRLQELLDDYSLNKECFLHIDYNLFKEFLESTVVLIKCLNKKVKKTILAFKKYFLEIKNLQIKIRFLGYRAWSFAAFKPKDIVHRVLGEGNEKIF
jgi:hypothetical protein